MRKTLFWTHLVAGVAAGAVILIMSLTGVILTCQSHVIAWQARGFRVTPPPGAARLPAETLLAGVAGQRPTALTVRSDPAAPVEVSLGRDRTLFLDPYTGAVRGASSAPAFFHAVEDWHRWLGAGTSGRAAGRAVTGACNLLFLFLVISGIYLWWPATILWFRGGLRGRARDFNWHNVIGFWCAVPLAAVTFTGVVISYPWASRLLYRMAGERPPEMMRPRGPGGGRAQRLAGVNALWERAERQVPGWRSITLRLGPGPGGLTIDEGSGRPDRRSQLSANRWEPFSSYSLGRRLRIWFRFIHTGEAGGWPGQVAAGLASLGGVFLVWTGISLALRRLARARRRKVVAPVAVLVEKTN